MMKGFLKGSAGVALSAVWRDPRDDDEICGKTMECAESDLAGFVLFGGCVSWGCIDFVIDLFRV